MRFPLPLILALLVAAGVGFGAYRFLEFQAAPAHAAGENGDILVISKGEPVNLRDHLVQGKYTLFDYYADWCPPCRELSPALESLARDNANLALRKIDIVDWDHPVAAQQGVADLPFLRLFGPDGELIEEGDNTVQHLHELFGFGAGPRSL